MRLHRVMHDWASPIIVRVTVANKWLNPGVQFFIPSWYLFGDTTTTAHNLLDDISLSSELVIFRCFAGRLQERHG